MEDVIDDEKMAELKRRLKAEWAAIPPLPKMDPKLREATKKAIREGRIGHWPRR